MSTPQRSPYDAVIFDLDGTLYAMTKRFKVLLSLHCKTSFFRLPKYMKLRETFRGVDCGDGTTLRNTIAERFDTTYGTHDSAQWMERSFTQAFIATLPSLRNRTTLIPLLQALREAGIKTAVLSDFGAVEARLAALKIPAELFDARLSAEDMGALKPSPRPFTELLSTWKISPDKTLMVGDRTDTDGNVSQAVGMSFFLVDGKSNTHWDKQLAQLRQTIFPPKETL